MLLKYFHNQQSTVKTEVLAGLTVAVALVPEAVAFSLIAGLSPLVGLYSAFVISLIISVMGGHQCIISCATGAIAVVIVGLVISDDPEDLFYADVVIKLIDLRVGLLKLVKSIRLVRHLVVNGFEKEPAIVLLMSQLNAFKVASGP